MNDPQPLGSPLQYLVEGVMEPNTKGGGGVRYPSTSGNWRDERPKNQVRRSETAVPWVEVGGGEISIPGEEE